MRIQHFENEVDFINKAAGLLIQEIDRKPELLLCAATGNSPLLVYRRLVYDKKLHVNRYKNLNIIKLDEWVSLESNAGSCETYLRKELINPLRIKERNYIGFDEKTKNPIEECKRVQDLLDNNGPIDMCVLGLGKNGHLGFNEPPGDPTKKCHVAHLTAQSQEHDMVANQLKKPEFGMTLGIQDILNSKRILLLISGKGKEKAKQRFLSSKVDPQCPASFLWMHSNVDCLILEELFK
ncbi:galactosamine-6-phosphate isomerase [Flagellimonas sp. W118]|uniref:galactosamine-6-phosphate isomerase n=1 Tax=Flagellimonas sp. W118 TaxID=3410791 RepID=UPI003BF45F92